MELKDLSTNWKKLQASIGATEPSKRKANEVLQPTENGVKRRRTNNSSSHVPARTKQLMGIRSSKNTQSSPPSLALWAQENNISSQDLTEAYGPTRKFSPDHNAQSTALQRADERINEGLSTTAETGKYLAIDCEMVGVGPDPDNDSALARISVVNYHGHQVYDSFVSPKEAVTDYRTFVSGITPDLLRSARSLEVVQTDIAKLLNGRILVGHSLRNDLDALLLGHPKRDIRDTSRHPEFRKYAAGRTPGLKKLAKEILGVEIQIGEHSSIEDARIAMLLFKSAKEGFEADHVKNWGPTLKLDDQEGNGKRTKKRKKKR